MALFLESSYSSSNYSGNLTDIAFDGIALMQEEMQLMEAIYKADFIMHEQNKNLSESARVLKEGNFLGNVFAKIIEWVKKAWEWLKNFFTKIKDKIVEIYNRIKDHLTGNTITIGKSELALGELAIEYAKNTISWGQRLMKASSVEAMKSMADSQKKYEDGIKKKAVQLEKIKGTTNISNTYFDKLAAIPKELEEEADSIVKDALDALESAEEEVTKRHADVSSTDSELADKVLKHAKETIALKRDMISLVKSNMTYAGGFAARAAAAAAASATASKASPDKAGYSASSIARQTGPHRPGSNTTL